MRPFFLAVLLAASNAAAQTPTCDALDAVAQKSAREILAARRGTACCRESIADCLKAKAACLEPVHVAEEVCAMVKASLPREKIDKGLDQRARSLDPSAPQVGIALDEAMAAGEEQAKVKLVVYACTRCPFCKSLVPKLYQEVTSGPLKGKARLYFRPFPLKGHEGSTEGALAFEAAAKLGKFWPYFHALYGHFDEIGPEALAKFASASGLDAAAFKKKLDEEATRQAVVESKKEGLRNSVRATPTFFIDGRLYDYELEPSAIRDVVLEILERGAE